jgi:hypothetical protein
MTFPVKAIVFDWAGTMIDFGRETRFPGRNAPTTDRRCGR